jgi:hypothetical protein
MVSLFNNSDLSCLDLAEKVKGSFITELRNAITAMIYKLNSSLKKSIDENSNIISKSEVKKKQTIYQKTLNNYLVVY